MTQPRAEPLVVAMDDLAIEQQAEPFGVRELRRIAMLGELDGEQKPLVANLRLELELLLILIVFECLHVDLEVLFQHGKSFQGDAVRRGAFRQALRFRRRRMS